MTEADMSLNKPLAATEDSTGIMSIVENERALKLLTEMLAGNIIEIRPELDFTTEAGFSYPVAERILGVKGKDVVSILESLVDEDILRRDFFDRLLRCPQCNSLGLSPITHCPKCGSGNISRGRVLEHFVCKYVGLEEEFVSRVGYVCPKCRQELRTIGSDYQSQGLLRKCRDCGEVFNLPLIRWRCLRCNSLTAEDRVTDVHIYSYRLNDEKRNWLEFELSPKLRLVNFLKQLGYEVKENTEVQGRSGAMHSFDMLASRDDGIVTYDIAIGVKVTGREVKLEEVFAFDDKAYDCGIREKLLVIVPGLSKAAKKFASQQRIKVLEVRDLETVLSRGVPGPGEEAAREPFVFTSKPQLIKYLKQLGYQVEENTEVQGRSGAKHRFDILASRDDGIFIHHIAVGVEASTKPVELDKVFDFDDKAYDTGIMNKAFIAVPGLTPEARQFAQRQRIKVLEAEKLEPTG